jgi:hypothetical protein
MLLVFGPSGLCALSRNKVCTINGVFLSFFLSAPVTFLPEGVTVGLQNFAWGFYSQ